MDLRRGLRLASILLGLAATGGCAAGSSYYVSDGSSFAGESAAQAPPPAGFAFADEADGALSIAWTNSVSAEESEPSPRRARRDVVADATPRSTPASTGVQPNAPAPATGPPAATTPDAPAIRDLIIYTADVTLAIYEVDATQRAIAAAATEVGGFVARLDASTLVVRIPAASFDAFLGTVETHGRVIGRTIQADDVTEQFRDLQTRIENLAAMRDRLESMLSRAANVQEAIAIERELERVTLELESLRGRLRFLADRVAFSTVTLHFRALPREQLTGDVPNQLPVSWLRTLGLQHLMQ